MSVSEAQQALGVLSSNDMEGLSSKKRRLSASVEEVTYQKPKPKKRKNKKPKNDHDDLDMDLEKSLNRNIGRMDKPLLADLFSQRTKRFAPNLSFVELQDRQLPGKRQTFGCSSIKPVDDLAIQKLRFVIRVHGMYPEI